MGEVIDDVIVFLAENGPSHQAPLAEYTGKDPKTISRVFRAMVKRSLVFDTGEILAYRTRAFPIYWLTRYGINHSLLKGADPEKIRGYLRDFYSDIDLSLALLACDVVEDPRGGGGALKMMNSITDNVLLGLKPDLKPVKLEEAEVIIDHMTKYIDIIDETVTHLVWCLEKLDKKHVKRLKKNLPF